MKGLRSIPRILKINEINGFEISCLFNNGESRIINFEEFFKERGGIQKTHPAFKIMSNKAEFDQVEIIGNTLGWKNTGIYSKNFSGETVFYHYDLDPIVLYNSSKPDKTRSLNIGELIKNARKHAGLTQKELAKKSGTSKHYISRLENNKSDVELLTLKKIIEAGLNKKLHIQIG